MQDIWQKRLNKTKCRAAQIHKHSRAAWIWHVGCTSRLQEFPLSDTRPLHKGRFLANCYTIPVEFMQPQNIAPLCVCVCVFFLLLFFLIINLSMTSPVQRVVQSLCLHTVWVVCGSWGLGLVGWEDDCSFFTVLLRDRGLGGAHRGTLQGVTPLFSQLLSL